MNLDSILSDLKAERDRLDRAIAALEGAGGTSGSGPGRRGARRRRTMSAAARKRISAGMKARWAARKKSAGKAA